MTTKVYVGNLPFSTTDEQLKDLFSTAGEITEAIVIKNKYSGRSKGFGFVTFADEASVQKAIAELNGKSVEGREIKVTEARPLEERAPRDQKQEEPVESSGEAAIEENMPEPEESKEE